VSLWVHISVGPGCADVYYEKSGSVYPSAVPVIVNAFPPINIYTSTNIPGKSYIYALEY
jgi:hypothetical protein